MTYLTPNRLIITTVLCYVAITQIVRHVRWPGWVENESLRGNLSEFDETLIYYLFLLYVAELVFRRSRSLPLGRVPSSAQG